MSLDRRSMLAAGALLGIGASAATAGPKPENRTPRAGAADLAAAFGLEPGSDRSQTERLQAAVDEAQRRGVPFHLPAGRFKTGQLRLGSSVRLIGASRALTILEQVGTGPLLHADRAADIMIEQLTLDGAMRPQDDARGNAVVSFSGCHGLVLDGLAITRAAGHGIKLTGCAGRITGTEISHAVEAGIHALDSKGLEIAHNHIADCANNGIQVWRSEPGEDGTIVLANRIERIRAGSGGTGENGNGVNVFRAGSVLVADNRIADCAYSAVRANAASNVQITANSCQRIGEVALYAEFAFEGAVIAGNLVDTAAAGISVTNFEVGGRLAVIQGNLIRNLFRREHEPVDKRGEGIAVEADAAITGNVVEGAPTAGLVLGWGPHMRDIAATGNTIRACRSGILVSSDATAGSVLIASNLISGSRDGAIRAHDRGKLSGPDLARMATAGGRIGISGNLIS
jgi:uncharacterized secreted repeat protein (TIGR03808 family)